MRDTNQRILNSKINGTDFEEEVFLALLPLRNIKLEFNIKFPYANNKAKTTQIDLLCETSKAIYILEIKRATKYIKAESEESSSWYLVTKNSKVKIRNPIKQNEFHIEAYKQYREENNLADKEIKNIIVVPDSCKILVPSNKILTKTRLVHKLLEEGNI